MFGPFRTILLLTASAALSTASAAPLEGTFSIVARDPVTGELGVAVQSRAFNVGQSVAWAHADVGAIATQSWTNESFGPTGLDYLREGIDAETTLRLLLGTDEAPAQRQVGVVDAAGNSATWTGDACMSWAGDFKRENLACQGNLLAGEAVVRDMVVAFDQTSGTLAERLLAALEAGQAAGGDKRGQQSAALLVVRESERHPEYRERFVDLRVDDHSEPIRELRRLWELSIYTDMVECYLELAEEHDAAGRVHLAERDRAFVQGAMHRARTDPEPDAASLNALAWETAIRGVLLDDALAAAETAADLAPESPEILDTLAEVYWRRGERDDAIATAERALALAPEDAYLAGQLEKFRETTVAERR